MRRFSCSTLPCPRAAGICAPSHFAPCLNHALHFLDTALKALRCLINPVLGDESVKVNLPRCVDLCTMRLTAD
jgi:hypothetical protein